jgi:hypothetical protein
VTVNLLPWPTDSVIIVASLAGYECRSQMDSVHFATCRDCQRDVAYDGYTIERAGATAKELARPVEFLCLACFPKYNFGQVNHFEDHRGHKSQEATS